MVQGYEEAVKLDRFSAKQDDVDAQCNMDMCYESVAQSFGKAVTDSILPTLFIRTMDVSLIGRGIY